MERDLNVLILDKTLCASVTICPNKKDIVILEKEKNNHRVQ